MSYAVKDRLVALGNKRGRFHLYSGYGEPQLAAVVQLGEEETVYPGGRCYTRAALAVPGPEGFAYPLVLNMTDPKIARSLARIFEHIADKLAATYPTEDEIGDDDD